MVVLPSAHPAKYRILWNGTFAAAAAEAMPWRSEWLVKEKPVGGDAPTAERACASHSVDVSDVHRGGAPNSSSKGSSQRREPLVASSGTSKVAQSSTFEVFQYLSKAARLPCKDPGRAGKDKTLKRRFCALPFCVRKRNVSAEAEDSKSSHRAP